MAMNNTPANDVVVADKFKLSDLYKKEDWLSIWIAFILITVAAVGALTGSFDFSGAKFAKWGLAASEFSDPAKAKGFLSVFTGALWGKLGLTFASFAALFAIGNRLEGKKIVISGVFAKHSRDEYKMLIEQHGGKNVGSISKNTDYVLAGENMGTAKLEKANALDIRIIDEDEFLDMISD